MRAAILGLAGLLTSLVTIPANAADTGDLESLLEESVVSTASQSAEVASTAPATSTTITAEDLRRYGIRSLDEAINYLSLGMMTQNPLHSVEIGARGVLLTSDYGNHVLLLVNGHAMNEQWDGTAYFERGAAVPFELIDHVEVILGPGSVLYGSNAMLGVINVITKRAKDYAGGHLIIESEIPTSTRASAGYGHELTLFGLPAEITAQAEYYTQSGPSFSFGPQVVGNDAVTGTPKRFGPGAGTGVWGGTASRSYTTSIPSVYIRAMLGDFELNARGATYKRSTPYINQFNQTTGDFDDPNNTELDRWLSLDLRHRAVVSAVTEIRTRLYGDMYDFQQRLTSSAAEECLPGQVSGCRRYVLGISQWAGLELQGNFDWAHDGRLVTLLGVDGRVRRVAEKSDIADIVTGQVPGSLGAFDRTERVLGLYAQQTAQPWRPVSLNAGARFDADSRFGSALSPRAAVAVTPWEGGTLKAIYAEAFRAPTAYEQFYVEPSAQIKAGNLKPERVRSVEASIEQRFSGQRLLFGVFRSWWSDLVALDTLSASELSQAIARGDLLPDTTSGQQYRNVASIQDYGLNGSFDGAAVDKRLRYGLNVTGSYARIDPVDGPTRRLTVAPQMFGNARVSYDLGSGLPTLAVAAFSSGRAPADRAFDGGFTPTPFAPPQLFLRGALSGPFPGIRGLSYRASATWAAHSTTPYVAGPNQAATPTSPSAELAPVDRFRTAIGLQYDFGS